MKKFNYSIVRININNAETALELHKRNSVNLICVYLSNSYSMIKQTEYENTIVLSGVESECHIRNQIFKEVKISNIRVVG